MNRPIQLDWNFVLDRWPLLAKGVVLDLYMAIVGTIAACVLGLLIQSARGSSWTLLSRTAYGFTQVTRGIPFYVLLLWLYFGIASYFDLALSAVTCTIIALAITDSGKTAEIFRGGFLSIDSGQLEASDAIGLSHRHRYFDVLLPQVIRVVIPPLGNVFVGQIKGATFAAAIAVPEMVFQAQEMSVTFYRPFEAFAAVAVILITLVLGFSLVFLAAERALRLP
jgi:His/Glu/Gln/Arg/opine family amino acid ABC transporter permease subunit